MHIIGGIILLGLAAYFWFVLGQSGEEKSVTGFMKILRGLLGPKGYNILAKALAIFMVLAAISEFYKHFK